MYSFRTDNALKKHERLCDNHDYCNIVMPSKDKNIFKYNSGKKSLNVANLICFDLESLSIKNHSSQNNLEQSYTEKKSMEKFCKDLKDLAMEVINTKQKDMIQLTNKEKKYYESCKYCHICKKKFYNNKEDTKNIIR